MARSQRHVLGFVLSYKMTKEGGSAKESSGEPIHRPAKAENTQTLRIKIVLLHPQCIQLIQETFVSIGKLVSKCHWLFWWGKVELPWKSLWWEPRTNHSSKAQEPQAARGCVNTASQPHVFSLSPQSQPAGFILCNKFPKHTLTTYLKSVSILWPNNS